MTYAYQSHTDNDRAAMLQRIGVASVDALFETIPDALRLREALPVGTPNGDGLTELELERLISELVAGDTPAAGGGAVSFLGCGSYDHFIPAAVDALSSDGRFVTAYTPYQAEASQGSLQVFFEYQSLVARLTGMDIANASHYDVATACVEAALMATAATQRKKIVVPESLHFEYRAVLETVLASQGIEIVTLPTPTGRIEPQTLSLDSSVACVIVQHPNFFGGLENVAAIGEQVHAAGGLFVVCVDPISLGVLKNPASYGADIVVAEGQPLGIPMSFGGPYLGIMACRESLLRRIPGRLVGQTCDRRGERCWVLTMQTREQHIRRDKAASNICSNQGLMAIRAAIYLSLVGPHGLREVAEQCTQKAHYLASRLPSPLKLAFDMPFFKEVVIRFPSEEVLQNCCSVAYDENIFAGVPLSRFGDKYAGLLSIAVTEKRSREEIDELVRVLHRHS
ncbi:MAG: aminomethyl-transferring glycine dehydrogenase subunit GcvPA [Thermoguttaceae bacterium]